MQNNNKVKVEEVIIRGENGKPFCEGKVIDRITILKGQGQKEKIYFKDGSCLSSFFTHCRDQ